MRTSSRLAGACSGPPWSRIPRLGRKAGVVFLSGLLEPRSVPQELVIRPSTGWAGLRLRDVWEYRDLGAFLVWRDIKVRYKQTILGVAWAILQPLAAMVIFSLIFGRLAGFSSGEVPYPVFSFVGLVLWTFFAQSVGQASNSLVNSAELIRKVYFPRLLVPLASVFNSLFDLLISVPAVMVLMMAYHVVPSGNTVYVPLMVAIGVMAALGVSIWFSALNVAYRDVRYVVPFLVQLWLFVTPVIYPASFVTAKLKHYGIPDWVYGLNPMAGAVQGLRWALLGDGPEPWGMVTVSTIVSLLVVVLGTLYFRRVERTMADIV